jgi:hypothetical protein
MCHAAEVAIFNSGQLKRALALRVKSATSHAIDTVVDGNEVRLVLWHWHAGSNIPILREVRAFEHGCCWSCRCKHVSSDKVKLIEIMRV